ncbi:MAG: hypothetical protein ABIQ16_20370 [Polyangiaceae bacterium]
MNNTGPISKSSAYAANPQTSKLAAFQDSIVGIARELGSVRLLVHRHWRKSSKQSQLPAPSAPVELTVGEFLTRQHWFIEDLVMEVSGRERERRGLRDAYAC